jgi:hypothetical protein
VGEAMRREDVSERLEGQPVQPVFRRV